MLPPHPNPGTTTIALVHVLARTPREALSAYGTEGWAQRVLVGREYILAVRRLKKCERRRRRAQREMAGCVHHGAKVPSGARVDPHGQHRVIVEARLVIALSDWIDDKFYDTTAVTT